MIATISKGDRELKFDLKHPLDISIQLQGNEDNITAWYKDAPEITPVQGDGFIGDVNQGGSVNFRDINFNPHAHGTHTECVGHISKEDVAINEVLNNFFFVAQVVTIQPELRDKDDRVIALDAITATHIDDMAEAFVLRTLPNDEAKKNRQYSNTNPPYVQPEVMEFLVSRGINHFLIDLPSVDREEDGGALKSHRTFWDYPSTINRNRTITEFIYVDNSIQDGVYMMNLQVANFKNDAAPSRPVLYPVK